MLTFQINKVKGVLFTRRGLLSKIAGMFDPLGLASLATISLGQFLCLELAANNGIAL